MNPIPCAHCGNNFMRHNLDPEAPKLCNNCSLRETLRTKKKDDSTMDTIDILVKCPREIQNEIEELCINEGISFSQYFLNLHEAATSPDGYIVAGGIPIDVPEGWNRKGNEEKLISESVENLTEESLNEVTKKKYKTKKAGRPKK